MFLSTLIDALRSHNLLAGVSHQCESLQVTQITYDSRNVLSRALFTCKGASFRPEYLANAEKAGAIAYLSERQYASSLPCILVTDIRRAMAVTAAVFYQNPASQLKMAGITGTKGKTTTTYFLKAILNHASRRENAYISTIEMFDGKTHTQAALSTPEAYELHACLANAVKNHAEYAVVEVSSQAYKTDRVYGLHFHTGIFLNIGEDHISPIEHESMEDYINCKARLFENCDIAVINRQDPNSAKFIETAAKNCKEVLTFGTSDNCTYQILDVTRLGEKTNFTFVHNGSQESYTLSMSGYFNVENAMAALIAAKTFGVPKESIAWGLENTIVPGRMNVLHKGSVTIIVDYAHNELSFQKLYESVKQNYPNSKITVVMGCAGGKAQQRRKAVGFIASKYADECYLTSQEPNFEDPLLICRQIAEHLGSTPYHIITDREKAVRTAIEHASGSDVVILAGNGDAKHQRVNGKLVYYPSDLAIAKEYATY